MQSTDKSKGRFLRGKKNSKHSSLSSSNFHDDMWRMNSRGKFNEDDNLSTSSSVRKQKDHAPHLKVLRSMQELFVMAVEYHTYELKNKFQWYNSKIASQVAKLVEKIRMQLKGTNLNKMDPSSILAFLEKFRDTCDTIGIHRQLRGYVVGIVFCEEAGVIVIACSSIADEDLCNRTAR